MSNANRPQGSAQIHRCSVARMAPQLVRPAVRAAFLQTRTRLVAARGSVGRALDGRCRRTRRDMSQRSLLRRRCRLCPCHRRLTSRTSRFHETIYETRALHLQLRRLIPLYHRSNHRSRRIEESAKRQRIIIIASTVILIAHEHRHDCDRKHRNRWRCLRYHEKSSSSLLQACQLPESC